jgi:hypothetical protein
MNRRAAHLLILLACAAWISIPAARATDEFHAYVAPESSRVDIGTIAEVGLAVDGSAHQFNGYEITIQYDPRVISLVSVLPGPLMLEACPNWFNRLTETDSTLTYAHIILCDGVSLDGPGTLTLLRFSADTIGVSPVRIISSPDLSFFDAGEYVAPDHPTYPRQVVLHDGKIEVWDPATSGIDGPWISDRSDGSGQIHVYPNPVTESSAIRLAIPQDGPVEMQLFDPAGRELWRWASSAARAGVLEIPWPRSEELGRDLPGGVYFVRARSVSGLAAGRAVVRR